jgi:trehalose synthase
MSGCEADGTGAIQREFQAKGDPGTSAHVRPEPVPEQIEDTIEFYESHSMLRQAEQFAERVAGDVDQWHGSYMEPQPDALTSQASVWLTIYPRSVIAAPGETVIGTIAAPEFWNTLEDVGFQLMHALSTEQAGQIDGLELSPSIDGGFDRISLAMAPELGTEEDVRDLVLAAEARGALVAGDVIPLHTGIGPDFQLALMNHEEFPGIYNVIEIAEEDWTLLPSVDDRFGTEVIRKDAAQPLVDRGYIPGITDVLLEDPDSVNWSGWAATGPVVGADGETRRWIYAHLFKAGQPMLNWMDPTYAGRALQTGTMVRHVHDLGMRVNRLDAVPFLGLEPLANSPDANTYMTELAIMGTNDLAFTSRKLGGFTWVELNVPIDAYLDFQENGADVAYDFFTRAETLHPLITSDARLLRAAHRALLKAGADHSSLIHAMQNHDEITYQLISLGALDEVDLGGGETIGGQELKEQVLEEMRSSVAGEAAPYNRLYRPEENGIATTFAGFIAPAIGIGDPYQASEDEVARIRQAHLLVATANAMQPGMFAISEWDLVGALPIAVESVPERTAAGDYRWINRGAVDLLGENPDATASAVGLPEAQTLYGPVPEQLRDPDSFSSQIRAMVAARQEHDIANAELVAVPDVGDDAVCVFVMKLPDARVAVTALNYGREETMVTVDLSAAAPDSGNIGGGAPRDIIADEEVGSLSGMELTVPIDALTGRTLVVGSAEMMGGAGEEPMGGEGSGSSGEGSGSSSGDGSGSSGEGSGSGS